MAMSEEKRKEHSLYMWVRYHRDLIEKLMENPELWEKALIQGQGKAPDAEPSQKDSPGA